MSKSIRENKQEECVEPKEVMGEFGSTLKTYSEQKKTKQYTETEIFVWLSQRNLLIDDLAVVIAEWEEYKKKQE